MNIVKYYYNPYSNRIEIFKENRNKSGVYCWYNISNKKLYIGSSINITNRLYCYFSYKYLENEILKSQSLIYRSILKYDYIHFDLIILKYCNTNELLYWEQYFIDKIIPEYNILKKVRSNLRFKHLSVNCHY